MHQNKVKEVDECITVDDIRALGVGEKYCVRGCRLMCYKHNLSFDKLIKHGLPIKDVEHIQDSMVIKVIEIAKKRIEDARKI